MPQFFIKRPHAIDQFRKRAGYSDNVDNIRLEATLRQALQDQAKEGTNFLPSRKEGEFVLRIAVAGKEPVYAILVPTPDKSYDYYLSTIVTEAMYQSWTRQGRLGTLGDQLENRDQVLPTQKPMVWLRYVNRDGQEHFHEFLVEGLNEAIHHLVQKGTHLKDIQAFKQIRLGIRVHLPGFTP